MTTFFIVLTILCILLGFSSEILNFIVPNNNFFKNEKFQLKDNTKPLLKLHTLSETDINKLTKK